MHAVLVEALGAELGDRIWRAMLLGELESAVRERADGSTRVEWREFQRVEDAQHLRHFARFVLLVLERVGTESAKAASYRLWLGPTRDGTRYVPAAEQIGSEGSLAARVGVGVRQLERYTAVLQAAGVWQVWQPQEAGARAPKNFPPELRGETYAYNHYRLVDGVPRELRAHLSAYYERGGKRPTEAPTPTPAARVPAYELAHELPDAAAVPVAVAVYERPVGVVDADALAAADAALAAVRARLKPLDRPS